jgi:hypothetical protein
MNVVLTKQSRRLFASTGTGPNENPGNQLFRETLKRHCDEYRSASSRRSKRETILTAIADFQQKQGGRFLQRVFLTNEANEDQSSSNGKCTFDVVEGTAVFLKARQAFRYLLRESEGPAKSSRDMPQGMDTRVSNDGSKTSSGAAVRQETPAALKVASTKGELLDQRIPNDTNRSTTPAGFQLRDAMAGLGPPYFDLSTQILAAAARRDLQAASSGIASFPTMLPGMSGTIPSRTAFFRPFSLVDSPYSDGLGGLLVCEASAMIRRYRRGSMKLSLFPNRYYLVSAAEHDADKPIYGNDLTDCQ